MTTHPAPIERASYLIHLDCTEIVVRIQGEHRPQRGQLAQVVLPEEGE